MIDVATLPPHLRTEVTWWINYHPDPTSVSKYAAAMFVVEVLGSKTLATRNSCINAISEWHRDYLKQPDPFADNPYPYPLLTRYLPISFAEAWSWVKGLEQPQQAWAVLLLLCRFKWAEVLAWDGTLPAVPLTDEARLMLSGYKKPPPKTKPLAPPGCKVTDLHAALFLELKRRNVPEVTTATLYGRWSAMKFAVVDSPVGYFRCPVLPETRGGS